MIWVDLRGRSPQQFADMIVSKLAALADAASALSADTEDPAQVAGASSLAGETRTSAVDPRQAWAQVEVSPVPARSRLARQWDPVELGVHQVIGGGPMPPYIRRPHDELLQTVTDPSVAASRLVVLRGGSSTGKTRAAYEAIATRLGDWRLDYPLDSGALAARLEAAIPARTVLWLGELRHYAHADGGPAVLSQLADLLVGEGYLVITTVWPRTGTLIVLRLTPRPGRPAGCSIGYPSSPAVTPPDRAGSRRGHRRPGLVHHH